MRQTLDALNMKHVPVGVGDEVVPPSRARDDDEDWAFIDAGAYASVHADGQVLLLEAFEAADDGALTLLCISALTEDRRASGCKTLAPEIQQQQQHGLLELKERRA